MFSPSRGTGLTLTWAFRCPLRSWACPIRAIRGQAALDSPHARRLALASAGDHLQAGSRGSARSRKGAGEVPAAVDRKCGARHTAASAHQSGPCNRSEEHTSELQTLMRTSNADFYLKKNTKSQKPYYTNNEQYK